MWRNCFLANKAEVNVRDSGGETALYVAAQKGHQEMVELLLANKAEVNAADINGRTPLQVAMSNGHAAVAELLRLHGGHE